MYLSLNTAIHKYEIKMITQKRFTISALEVLDVKKRKYARYAVHRALKSGRLTKSKVCELCKRDSFDIEAHHVDYGKFLDVTWLCKICHGLAHRKGHHLNPENHKQTSTPFLHSQYNSISITFTLPIKEFLEIQSMAQIEKKPVSKFVRDNIYKTITFSCDEQLKFDFMETYDDSQKSNNSGICLLEQNASSM